MYASITSSIIPGGYDTALYTLKYILINLNCLCLNIVSLKYNIIQFLLNVLTNHQMTSALKLVNIVNHIS